MFLMMFKLNLCNAKPKNHTNGILLFKKAHLYLKKKKSGIYRPNYNTLGKFRTITEPFKKKLCIQNNILYTEPDGSTVDVLLKAGAASFFVSL